MTLPQPLGLVTGGGVVAAQVPHLALVAQTLRQMRQAGAAHTSVDGYEGIFLPTAVTMPQSAWAGIVELSVDSGFRACGQLYPDDQALIEAEDRHWCSATAATTQVRQ